LIYFIRDTETTHVKIGYSADPRKRFQQLQCATSHRLEMVGTAPGDKRREKELHREAAPFHVRGEWFRANRGLLDLMDSVLRPYPTVSGHLIRSVYLAGRFTPDLWRDQIVPKWSLGRGGFGSCGCPVDEDVWYSVERCVPVSPCAVAPGGSSLDYTGPFFVDLDGGHGPSGCGPHASAYDRCEWDIGHGVVGTVFPINARAVASHCRDAIDRADPIFAWMDSRECFGTLAEVGYAVASGKAVVVAMRSFDRQLWFAGALAHLLIEARSPRDAWQRFWSGQHD
jgi:hypothetical protein